MFFSCVPPAAIMMLGAPGGLRVSELLALKWEDVDCEAG